MPELIAFDVGTTLIHPSYPVLGQRVAEAFGVALSPALIERAFRAAISGNLYERSPDVRTAQARRFADECRFDWSSQSSLVLNLWTEIADAGGANSWLYTVCDPDAAVTLQAIKRVGHQVIAASNSDGSLVEELKSFGLLKYFDKVYDSGLLGVEKPDPRFYARILSEWKYSSAVYVGDDLINDCIGALVGGFGRVLLCDPLDLFPGLPSDLKVLNVGQVFNALGYPP